MSYIDKLPSEDANGKLRGPAERLIEACNEVDRLRKEIKDLKENGIHRFPGLSLRESPVRVQRLGFAWLDSKGQHRMVEIANYDTLPAMVCLQLRQLASGIEERARELPIGSIPP